MRADKHHVGGMDRSLERDNSTLGVLLRGALVSLAHVDPFHNHTVAPGLDAQNTPLRPLVVAGYNRDLITPANLHLFMTN